MPLGTVFQNWESFWLSEFVVLLYFMNFHFEVNFSNFFNSGKHYQCCMIEFNQCIWLCLCYVTLKLWDCEICAGFCWFVVLHRSCDQKVISRSAVNYVAILGKPLCSKIIDSNFDKYRNSPLLWFSCSSHAQFTPCSPTPNQVSHNDDDNNHHNMSTAICTYRYVNFLARHWTYTSWAGVLISLFLWVIFLVDWLERRIDQKLTFMQFSVVFSIECLLANLSQNNPVMQI